MVTSRWFLSSSNIKQLVEALIDRGIEFRFLKSGNQYIVETDNAHIDLILSWLDKESQDKIRQEIAR